MIDKNCESCRDVPGKPEAFGCKTPLQVAVWDDDHGNKFFNCPLAFLSDSICEWYDEHTYNLKFGTAKGYREQSQKYIDAWRIYDYYVKLFSLDKAKEGNKPKDGLKDLGKGFLERKRGINE